jgi:hypothetical protein
LFAQFLLLSKGPIFMEPDPTAKPAPPGLPTVAPPTAGMFLRLFLVPAAIVAGLVALLMLFNWAGRYFSGRSWGSRSREQYLAALDDTNTTIRWEAASDLAQQLLRDDALASDVDFALQLNARLERARAANAPAEENFARRIGKLEKSEITAEKTRLDNDRKYILYLGSCLGNFMVPVGAPLLGELAQQDKGLEPHALATQRRQALWALANLGENLKRFDKLSGEQQGAILDSLQKAEKGEQGALAKKTGDYLRQRQAGKADSFGLAPVLEKCADAEDPSVREMTAFAMNFWHGSPAEETRMEDTLVRLTNDVGRGEDELAQVREESPELTLPVTKVPGYLVRVNATIALARRGSSKVPLGLLEEMLSPDKLRERFVIVNRQTHKEGPDEAVATSTEVNALKAVVELHQRQPNMDLSKVRPLIDQLAGGSNSTVSTEARKVQLALDNKNQGGP